LLVFKLLSLISILENSYATICELFKNPQSTFNLFMVADEMTTRSENDELDHQEEEHVTRSSQGLSLENNLRTPGLLIELLQEVSKLNDSLNRTSSISVLDTIKTYLRMGLENMYARAKVNILRFNREHHLNREQTENSSYHDSNVVYSLIVFSRDTIEFFKKSSSNNANSAFGTNRAGSEEQQQMIDIVIWTLYAGLMRDVRTLFENHMNELDDVLTI
jgi:hypothetical protein